MDWGSQLSAMFGDHKSAQVVEAKHGNGHKKVSDRHRSSTTNSYNKCIKELASKFPEGIADLAIKTIDKHDQNNFEEVLSLGNVYADSIIPGGQKTIIGSTTLHIKGEYKFKFFAHCKTVEMWIETTS